MQGWYLIQTKPKQEDRAVVNLELQGVNAFCHKVFVEKIIRGKRKVLKEVLFPNYLFVQFDHDNVSALSINYTRGVNRIISFGNQPSTVPDELIAQLKKRVDQSNDNLVSDFPEKGEHLQVLDGPFKGLNAIFSHIEGDFRAAVFLSILKQKVKALLTLEHLKAK
jgi:transcriptional antiterminator RfaH